MNGVSTDPGLYLALGCIFSVLGVVGFVANSKKTNPLSEYLLHPIRNRTSAREATERYVSGLELSAHYLYVTGLLSLLAWLILLLSED